MKIRLIKPRQVETQDRLGRGDQCKKENLEIKRAPLDISRVTLCVPVKYIGLMKNQI
jgi:hypothetical protein